MNPDGNIDPNGRAYSIAAAQAALEVVGGAAVPDEQWAAAMGLLTEGMDQAVVGADVGTATVNIGELTDEQIERLVREDPRKADILLGIVRGWRAVWKEYRDTALAYDEKDYPYYREEVAEGWVAVAPWGEEYFLRNPDKAANPVDVLIEGKADGGPLIGSPLELKDPAAFMALLDWAGRRWFVALRTCEEPFPRYTCSVRPFDDPTLSLGKGTYDSPYAALVTAVLLAAAREEMARMDPDA